MKVDYLVEEDSSEEMLVFLLLRDHVVWKQNLIGYQNKGIYLGHVVNDPNMLSLTYVRIDDKVICFYCGVSQRVNHGEIDNFLKKEYPDVPNIEADTLVFKFHNFNKGEL